MVHAGDCWTPEKRTSLTRRLPNATLASRVLSNISSSVFQQSRRNSPISSVALSVVFFEIRIYDCWVVKSCRTRRVPSLRVACESRACKFSLVCSRRNKRLFSLKHDQPLSINLLLYNKLSYARILIGSQLWSIGGQTHGRRQRSIQIWQLRDSLNQSQFFSKHSNQSFWRDNRLRLSAIFVSIKVAKCEIKRHFFRIF